MTTVHPQFIPVVGTTYTKITIDGTTYSTAYQLDVEKNISDFNATSNFSVEFNNFIGTHKTDFSLNDEVIIYADIGTNPPTTKLFTGIIEDITFSGSAENERVTITGRDYGAVLQDMTVQPIIFKDQDAGLIARTIVQNNADNVVTTNNIDITTGTTIELIGFNHKCLFEALKELAELSNCYFYVDNDKDVHFIAKESVPSYRTFDNKSVYHANFKKEDRDIFNKVWVYGDRVLTGKSDFVNSDGAGSVFTLDEKPHNIRVYISGTSPALTQPGGILGMDDPYTQDVKWLLNFHEKQVVFTSGAAAGDNRPFFGSGLIYVEYDRTVPLIKFRQDDDSIAKFGPKTKIIKDNNLKSYTEVDERAKTFLADNKDFKIQGTIDLKGIINIDPGNTCIVDLPWHGIENQIYTVLSAYYSFNKSNNLSNKVMTLEVNKKTSDFTDTLKNQILKIRNLEVGPLEGNFTQSKTATRYVDVDNHWEVWKADVGANFILHSEKHGQLHNEDSRIGVGNLQQGILGSVLVESGGGY